jgi:hypothetical protein
MKYRHHPASPRYSHRDIESLLADTRIAGQGRVREIIAKAGKERLRSLVRHLITPPTPMLVEEIRKARPHAQTTISGNRIVLLAPLIYVGQRGNHDADIAGFGSQQHERAQHPHPGGAIEPRLSP